MYAASSSLQLFHDAILDEATNGGAGFYRAVRLEVDDDPTEVIEKGLFLGIHYLSPSSLARRAEACWQARVLCPPTKVSMISFPLNASNISCNVSTSSSWWLTALTMSLPSSMSESPEVDHTSATVSQLSSSGPSLDHRTILTLFPSWKQHLSPTCKSHGTGVRFVFFQCSSVSVLGIHRVRQIQQG